MIPFGKQLIYLGCGIALLGFVLLYADKFLGHYKNPFDFNFKKGNLQVYIPLGSSILVSLLLSLAFYFFRK